MIQLEGRTTADVDEFMLRLGHVKTVCWRAVEADGVRHRLERDLAEVLTNATEVPAAAVGWVGQYLLKKRLCRVNAAPKEDGESGRRYDNLILEVENGQARALRDVEAPTSPPAIWWQDWCLAQPGVRSHLGSVGVGTKSSSKTPISHIVDWAGTLGLLSRSGQPSSEAHLLAELSFGILAEDQNDNPYIIGAESAVLLSSIAQEDSDIFTRLLSRLAQYPGVLDKGAAADCFMETVEALDDEADSARYLTPRQSFQLTGQLRDLKRAAHRSKSSKAVNSTVWHRTASRMESYVDLGFLRKGAGSDDDKFKYVYEKTPLLTRVVESFDAVDTIDEWLEWKMAECLYGVSTKEPLGRDELRTVLPRLVAAIRSPAAVPINALALGIVVLASKQGRPIHLGTARESIERLAKEHEDVGRLARGSSGQRSEYVNLNLRKL